MSRIKKKGESIQRKLEEDTQNLNTISMDDIFLQPPSLRTLSISGIVKNVGLKTPEQNSVINEIQNDSKPEKQLSVKEKVTFYLSDEVMAKFNEVCAKRMMRNEKMNRSELISKAIYLLWKEEKTYDI